MPTPPAIPTEPIDTADAIRVHQATPLLWDVTPQTVRAWAKAGYFRYRKVHGRLFLFSRSDILRFASGNHAARPSTPAR